MGEIKSFGSRGRTDFLEKLRKRESENVMNFFKSKSRQKTEVTKMGQLCAKQGENTGKEMPHKGERPPTPRQLKDILNSPSRANEFHDYLAKMDKTYEEFTKQTFLNFALKCNELRRANNKKEIEKILAVMSSEFFNNPTRAKRLALRNEVTRDQCKKY